jgi:myo-inositol 2-dehydrogenase/D-chiro-inositol 1-dehydrogenase
MKRSHPSRRSFLKTTGAAAAASALPLGVAQGAWGAGSDQLKIGLVGCGGRGSGALINALHADPGTVLWALGDAFADQCDTLARRLTDADESPVEAARIQLPPERHFSGFDCHQRVTDAVDVVLFASPPCFRPMQIDYAVRAGKHVFAEKPAATDAHGVRRVLAAARLAEQNGTAFAHGFCWRAHLPGRETMAQVHGGRIGKVRALYMTYLAGPLWHRGDKPEWSRMEHQLRNWLYFTPLSGDHLVEQAIHSVDKMMWAMQDEPPLHCTATGGRQVRTDEKYGNVYDHFDVNYEWTDGALGVVQCRQMDGCLGENKDTIVGAAGVLKADGWGPDMRAFGDFPWHWEGKNNDMYQTEHDELFASIRAGKPLQQGVAMAHSTLAGIMGRMSAYTGQRVTWEMALNSEERLLPADDEWAWGPGLDCPVATPGKTKFV